MLNVPAAATAPPPADLVRQLTEVARQFASLLAELRTHTQESGLTAEQAALQRLLAGDGGSEEAVAAGLSFPGARLLVALLPSGDLALRLVECVRGERGSVAIRRAEQLVVLVRGVPRRAGDDRGRRDAARVAAAVVREVPSAGVGVSSPLTGADQACLAYAEAVETAALAARDGEHVAFADECWARLAVQRLARQASSALPLDNPIARLRDHDVRRGTDLARTLGTWLAHNCDTATTAAALSLHPNTLRYRIRRVRELCALDLDDADARALAHLLLREG